MFSIVIPLYNKEKYILQCLQSVFKQTYKYYEVIVIDDGSIDNGAQLVKNHYPQVKLISQENQGVSIARNNGILASKYSFIAFLDADDIWHQDYLEKVSEVINENNEIKIIGTQYSYQNSFLSYFSGFLKYYEIKDYFKMAVKNTLFSSSSTVINKQLIIDNKVLFKSDYKRGEDIDFWLRINMLPGKAFYINNLLVYYFKGDANQATHNLVDIEKTLVGNLADAYKDEYVNNSVLKRFVSLYIYLTLYPYFYNEAFHKKSKKVLKQIPQKRIWLQLAYCLPLSIGKKIISYPNSARIFRLYLKFFTRYFY